MAGLVEIASYILARSEKRVEVSAHNLANVTSSGFKKQVGFTDMIQTRADATGVDLSLATDFSPGKAVSTSSRYDLSIEGGGFFVVRADDRLLYTRDGQFRPDAEGRLLTPGGHALQARGGGDVVLGGSEFEVAADGTVLEQGRPVARIAIVDFEVRTALTREENGLFAGDDAAALDVERPLVRQGMLEASNVSTGDEMVAIMEALRRAETGQRLVGVYDELMGRALTSFGQN